MNDNNEDVILVTQKDYLRIQNILETSDSDNFENLELELDRARILSDDEVPHDLVTMNSKVRYEVQPSNQETIITLVYPHEANSDEGKISILASLGSALLGLRVGQSINWQFPDGQTKKIKVLEVVYQPEASQDWHL